MNEAPASSWDVLSLEEEAVLVWVRQIHDTLPRPDGFVDPEALVRALLADGASAKGSAGAERKFQRDGVTFSLEFGSDLPSAVWLRLGGPTA